MGLFLGKTQIAYRGVQFDDIYPVGSIYISIDGTHPALGTWEPLATGRCLWNVDSSSASLGQPIAAGLPNIKGTFNGGWESGTSWSGATSKTGGGGGFAGGSSGNFAATKFDAHAYNSIYADENTTVQPPAIGVTMFERTA